VNPVQLGGSGNSRQDRLINLESGSPTPPESRGNRR